MSRITVLSLVLATVGHARRLHSDSEVQNGVQSSSPSLTTLANLLMESPTSGFAGAAPQVMKGHAQFGQRAAPKMAEAPARFDVKEMAGVTEPLGFFDPAGFTADATEGKIRFYREVELKHARLGMLAALGFVVGEQFHPLFGGDIDAPSYLAFQQTPLETFWGLVVLAISIPEVFSVYSFNNPKGGEPWSIRSDWEPGNFNFDPLNLKPTDPEALKEMQTKELNNGRLAMLAAAGMIAQEYVSGQKLF